MKNKALDIIIISAAVISVLAMLIYSSSQKRSSSLEITYPQHNSPSTQPEEIIEYKSAGGNNLLEEDEWLPDITVEFPLDLNTATAQQLEFIPQIGEVTAQRIIQYREALGSYTSLEQLMEIKGIGQKTFDTISAYLIIN